MRLSPSGRQRNRATGTRGSALQSIREALAEFAAGLRLEQEELPTTFDTTLVDASLLLEDSVGREFSASLAKRAVALRLASRVLVEDPAPETMALVLNEFGSLVADLASECRRRPGAAEWSFARQYNDLVEHLNSPRPEENQGFVRFPAMLEQSQWLQTRLEMKAAAAGLDIDATPAAEGLDKDVAKRWMRRAGARLSGKLCTMLEELQGAVEYRSRQVWYLRRSGSEERSLPQMYIFGHTDLFPDVHSALSETSIALEVAKLQGLALGLQLPDFALCLESAEWMSQYALSFLLPPAPEEWSVRSSTTLSRLLSGRLSRWYFCAFDHKLEPLEMAATVLRVGRPLFYERVASHALFEYSLLQGVSFTRHAASSWLEIQSGLERDFQALFDGYLLRLLHYPRLRTPEGWCDYLEALDALHFGGGHEAEFLEYRHDFLKRRGLHSVLDILYRTAASHSAIN